MTDADADFLRSLAQNDYMIDGRFLPTGVRLLDIANGLANYSADQRDAALEAAAHLAEKNKRLRDERDALAAAMPSEGADAAMAYAAEHSKALTLAADLEKVRDERELLTVALFNEGMARRTQSSLCNAAEADAERWRWWRSNGMQVVRDPDSDWNCWLTIPCIPYRMKDCGPDALTDALIKRFPMTKETLNEQQQANRS